MDLFNSAVKKPVLPPTKKEEENRDKFGGAIKKKKNSRRKHRNSHLGCATCKKRRIKCDESLPSCINCVKGKLHCAYLNLDEGSRQALKMAQYNQNSRNDMSDSAVNSSKDIDVEHSTGRYSKPPSPLMAKDTKALGSSNNVFQYSIPQQTSPVGFPPNALRTSYLPLVPYQQVDQRVIGYGIPYAPMSTGAQPRMHIVYPNGDVIQNFGLNRDVPIAMTQPQPYVQSGLISHPVFSTAVIPTVPIHVPAAGPSSCPPIGHTKFVHKVYPEENAYVQNGRQALIPSSSTVGGNNDKPPVAHPEPIRDNQVKNIREDKHDPTVNRSASTGRQENAPKISKLLS